MKRVSILSPGGKRIRPGTIAVLSLLPLILVFAVFEYRWLESASRQDGLKMNAALRSVSEGFLLDLNLDMMLPVKMLAFSGSVDRDPAGRELGKRLAGYRRTARFPSLVKDVYLLYPDGSLYRLDGDGRTLIPATDGDATAAFVSERSGGGAAFFREAAYSADRIFTVPGGLLRTVPVLSGETPVGKAVGNAPAMTNAIDDPRAVILINIDQDVLVREAFPLLVMKHFSPQEGYGEYSVRIMNTGSDVMYVYRNTGKIVVTDAPDVRLPLFGGTTGDILYLFDGAVSRSPLPELPGSRPPVPSAGTRFMRTVTTEVSAVGDAPDGERRGFVFIMPKADEIVAVAEKRNDANVRIFIASSVESSGNSTVGAYRRVVEKSPARADDSGWYLMVLHPSGGIDRAVERELLFNLALSYGILLLMYASVVVFHLAGRRAERISERERTFIASVSHELKTPVAVIRSASENMASGLIRSPEKTEQYGKLIREESGRLAGMIERVLLVSGMSSGVFRAGRELLDPRELIDASAERIGGELVKRSVRLVRTDGGTRVFVLGDRVLLCSAIENLLSNAVKYGPEGSTVELSLAAAARGRRRFCEIRVADAGPGVPRKERRRIFEPFYRGRNAAETQIQGSGLGLSLALGIAKAHGGTVRYEQVKPTGSAFVLRLPAAEIPEGEPS